MALAAFVSLAIFSLENFARGQRSRAGNSFTAACLAKRATSPLRGKDEVEVIGMPAQSECEHEIFLTIRWGEDGLAVPLGQLRPVSGTGAQTKEAIADWHYWVQMGYKF
jgi:calcium binding protein